MIDRTGGAPARACRLRRIASRSWDRSAPPPCAPMENRSIDGSGWPPALFLPDRTGITICGVEPGACDADLDIPINLETWNSLSDARKAGKDPSAIPEGGLVGTSTVAEPCRFLHSRPREG